MPLPEPQPGLVISYGYLWGYEHRAGLEEGRKSRPCVIITAATSVKDGALVRVVPITHRQPDDMAAAMELSPVIKRHLGLDDDRSWIVFDEANEFVWPGFDLRPNPHKKDQFSYGFLPPRLFSNLIVKIGSVWKDKRGRIVTRL